VGGGDVGVQLHGESFLDCSDNEVGLVYVGFLPLPQGDSLE
jgi:hypothetical protein